MLELPLVDKPTDIVLWFRKIWTIEGSICFYKIILQILKSTTAQFFENLFK